jgi:hypothetical protein
MIFRGHSEGELSIREGSGGRGGGRELGWKGVEGREGSRRRAGEGRVAEGW